MRIHTLPRFFIERWQLKELKGVITDAYHNVPPYKALCDEKRVCPKDINTLADIQKFPIITKDIFRKHPLESLVDQRFPQILFEWHQTSGSTGEPFRFPLNVRYHFQQKFGGVGLPHIYLDRYLYWRRYSLRHVIEKFRICEIRLKRTQRAHHYLHIKTQDLRERPDEVFEKLLEFGPDTIESRPTLLVELARLAETNSYRKRPVFRFAYANGELLTESQRKYIESIFGCEVYSRYGLEECWGVAVECAMHNGLHISEESFLVEILNDEGHTLPQEEYGRVVITHFYNRTLPFIRYDAGDYGKIISEKCPCGLWTKRIIVKGRTGGFLSFGGRKFNYAELQKVVSDFHPIILRYQLAKISENSAELRIIPTKKFSFKTISLLENEFTKKFSATLKVKTMNSIPYLEGGKTQFIVDETSATEK